MKKPVALVHGYTFDPANPERDPRLVEYPGWKANMDDRPVVEFTWFSAGGPKWKMVPRAWSNGYAHTYRWAYAKLAVDAAEKLYRMSKMNWALDVVAHSLGTRVVLLAAKMGADLNRVVLLSGAELCSEAEEVATQRPDIEFLNAYSRGDSVIDHLAENFANHDVESEAIGNNGLLGHQNWHNVILDNEEVKKWASDNYGWNLRGDIEESSSNHSTSHSWDGNWPLYLKFLDGDDLSGLPDKAMGNLED